MRRASLLRAWAACMMLAAHCAWGHEFWLEPQGFRLQAGDDLALSIRVGENFEGGLVALSQPLFLQLKQKAVAGDIDLRSQVPATGDAGQVVLPLAGGGTQLVFADTQPAHLELNPGRFFAYLHDEGLDFVNEAREKQGQAGAPSRERFRRHVKTLVHIDGAPPADGAGAALQRTGQRMEIVPLADPYASAAGRDLGFQVFFEGHPLAQALVKFWYRRGGQTLIIRTHTNAQGRVAVSLPWAGTWMASVVHMTPAIDRGCDCDWESYWANLTFELPQPPR